MSTMTRVIAILFFCLLVTVFWSYVFKNGSHSLNFEERVKIFASKQDANHFLDLYETACDSSRTTGTQRLALLAAAVECLREIQDLDPESKVTVKDYDKFFWKLKELFGIDFSAIGREMLKRERAGKMV